MGKMNKQKPRSRRQLSKRLAYTRWHRQITNQSQVFEHNTNYDIAFDTLPSVSNDLNSIVNDENNKSAVSDQSGLNINFQNSTSIENFKIEGARIVQIQQFLDGLQQLNNHCPQFGCNFNNLKLVSEIRSGLESKLLFKCNMCNFSGALSTYPQKPNAVDINTAAVVGIINIGAGYTQLQSLFSAMDIPPLQFKAYKSAHTTACEAWEKSAIQSMEEAAEEERKIATESGSVNEDGTPLITVVCDGSWAKRSYRGGGNYNSLSGVAAIVGLKSKKILYIGIKNKYCTICQRAANKDIQPKDHVCYKNWTGSSTSMESSIIAEGFCRSLEMYNIIYSKMIGDGDSSCYRKILECRPYNNCTVEKIECRNHLLRNYCNKLREIGKSKAAPVSLRNVINTNIMRARTAVTKAIAYRKKQNSDDTKKVLDLKKDIINSVSHIFGEHKECSVLEYFCSKSKPDDINYLLDLEHFGLKDRLMTAVRYLANHSKSLIEDVDNNTVEQFNSIVAKYTGGKRINYTMKQSYQGRCMAATVSRNTNGRPLYSIHKYLNNGVSPGKILKNAEMKRKRHSDNSTKRKLFMSTTKNGPDGDYGDVECQRLDLDKNEYDDECKRFLEKLKKTSVELKEIEVKTRLQADSIIWRECRKKLLTASIFGKICKMRPSTSCKATVKSILYKDDLFAKSVIWGRTHEDVAKEAVKNSLAIEIDQCGLFINQKWPYLGASPDGVCSDGSIMEIKCPYAARELTIREADEKKKINFIIYENEEYRLKTNHVYYYQVQGQLNICNKNKCHFVVWTPKDFVVIDVIKDSQFFETMMLHKLYQFYHNCLLPEIIDPRYTRNMDIREPTYIQKAQEEISKMKKDDNC